MVDAYGAALAETFSASLHVLHVLQAIVAPEAVPVHAPPCSIDAEARIDPRPGCRRNAAASSATEREARRPDPIPIADRLMLTRRVVHG